MNVSPFNPGDKVVAYCRYSEGDEQGLKNQSTEEQADAIRKFCSENGLDLVKVFADPFASGRSVAKRDHYLEMLSYLLHKKKPDVQGVVLWDFERYGRNYDQAQLDAARLRMAGYKLFSLQQPITDNGPFSHVLEAMYFASAQNQSDMISADVKRALQHNYIKYKVIPRSCIPDGWIAVPVDMGLLSDGTPRIGYKAEPDPAMVEDIRRAVEARIAGEPIRKIKLEMPKIFRDHPEKIEKLFRKPLLYGCMTYGGTEIEDFCKPIIDKQTWEKLQVVNNAVKGKNRKPGSGAWSKDRTILSGLCWCGTCGERVYIDRRQAKGHLYETYYCSHKHNGVRRAMLENAVIDAAFDILSGEKYESAKKAFLDAPAASYDTETEEMIQKEIRKLDGRIDAITEAIAEAGSSRALLLKLTALEAQREDLISRLEPEDPDKFIILPENIDRLRDLIISVLKNEKSTADEIRNALSLFISAIIIYPEGRIAIRHTLPGFSPVESEFGGVPSAPPEGSALHSQSDMTSMYYIT